MSGLISQDSRTISLSRRVLELCVTGIVELLDALGVGENPEWEISFNLASFHYPIHRYLALFASNAISRQGMFDSPEFLYVPCYRHLMAYRHIMIQTPKGISYQVFLMGSMTHDLPFAN